MEYVYYGLRSKKEFFSTNSGGSQENFGRAPPGPIFFILMRYRVNLSQIMSSERF